jgi:uncharacterized protein
MRKIVIAGGSGFLGQVLQDHFCSLNDGVTVLTRKKPAAQKDGVDFVEWDAQSLGAWVSSLEGCDMLINLTGRTVNCRYNETNKRQIVDSRVKSTEVLGRALAGLTKKPKLWLNASSATIYKGSHERANDEETGIIGEGFSVGVCQLWEKAFADHAQEGVRQVALRTAMVIGRGGPFLTLMSKIVRSRLGGAQGNGRQMVSWLHEADWLGAIEFLVDHEDITGAVNLSSPNPLTNRQMMQALRKVLGVSIGLPAYTWMVHLGARLMQTEAELPLKSRYVVPSRLLKEGYKFKFEFMEQALADLVLNR